MQRADKKMTSFRRMRPISAFAISTDNPPREVQQTQVSRPIREVAGAKHLVNISGIDSAFRDRFVLDKNIPSLNGLHAADLLVM